MGKLQTKTRKENYVSAFKIHKRWTCKQKCFFCELLSISQHALSAISNHHPCLRRFASISTENRQFSALKALENHRRRSIMALSVTSALHRFLKPSYTDAIWLKSLPCLRRDAGSLRFPPPCWRVRTRVRRRACANHRQGGRDYVNETPNESQVDTLFWLIYESHKLWLAVRKEF